MHVFDTSINTSILHFTSRGVNATSLSLRNIVWRGRTLYNWTSIGDIWKDTFSIIDAIANNELVLLSEPLSRLVPHYYLCGGRCNELLANRALMPAGMTLVPRVDDWTVHTLAARFSAHYKDFWVCDFGATRIRIYTRQRRWTFFRNFSVLPVYPMTRGHTQRQQLSVFRRVLLKHLLAVLHYEEDLPERVIVCVSGEPSSDPDCIDVDYEVLTDSYSPVLNCLSAVGIPPSRIEFHLSTVAGALLLDCEGLRKPSPSEPIVFLSLGFRIRGAVLTPVNQSK